MKFVELLAFVLVLGIVSCGETNPEIKTRKVYQDTDLTEDYPYVVGGDKIVFHYYYQAEDEEQIADDEYAEDFYLAIREEEGQFVMNSDAFAVYDFSFVYREYCFCLPANRYALIDFDLTGEEQSNGNWKLSGEVTVLMEYLDEETEEVLYTDERKLNLSGNYQLSDFQNQ